MNIFLNSKPPDLDTAIMYERALIHDIGNAVAYTDGEKIFINTPDNLFKILPEYCPGMLKWLLWHERYHMELRHHKRYFKYLEDLESMDEKATLTKNEVNIIMDILVHDSLSKMFPELVEIAETNLAQMRDRNALRYTFKTFTLEDMLAEYAEFKQQQEEETGNQAGGSEETEESNDSTDSESNSESKPMDKTEDEDEERKECKQHHTNTDAVEETDEEAPEESSEQAAPEPKPRHDEVDWDQLDKRDSKEFIDKDESNRYMREIEKLKNIKIKLGKLTETMNGLVTSTRKRTYAVPSSVYTGCKLLIKGSQPGRTSLFLCFDASGSMGYEMRTFKDIISKAIPQAMRTPTTWFSGFDYDGATEKRCRDDEGRSWDYYKGTFQDFMNIHASSGYGDDGDRTIEMCWKAEQLGYTPIGVTDGGGKISWSRDMIKQLKRTVLVGPEKKWLEDVHRINPNIQILDISI
jgi:hypothetical protein